MLEWIAEARRGTKGLLSASLPRHDAAERFRTVSRAVFSDDVRNAVGFPLHLF